ncbi:unnamed protein product [Owenia fusiformis]|uniref:protein-tyrosine-phosphatase n=1 Tax=Owenia fusiformis TaxID=6347 RepID=A0A8J1XVX5_OWEFU|nr:unnamed protein product [Owenia fusiformis]
MALNSLITSYNMVKAGILHNVLFKRSDDGPLGTTTMPDGSHSSTTTLRFGSSHEEDIVIHGNYSYPFAFWNLPFFPYIVCGAVVALVLIVVLIVVLCYFCHKKKGDSDISRDGQQICVYPVAKLNLKNEMYIQPEAGNVYLHQTSGPLPLQPVTFIKARGLLERRGSTASLTIDLPGMSPVKVPNPNPTPKESHAEEFLLSAGNRMSRKQLRNALKDVKALHEEFWAIPMNHPDSQKVAIAGSGMKNRYRTILPNESTRVHLEANDDDDPLSTYINANYIRGYSADPKVYIATQGVLPNTIVDFWNMIWQQDAPIIVSITKLQEKNKVKCENYIPNKTETYGNITVTVESLREKEGYQIRQITLQCKDVSKSCLHFWYTAWPDHKTPETAKQLLNLVQEVELRRLERLEDGMKPGPVVVHCSAGIGRTGCFIATSIGMTQLQQEYMVDILGIVCAMRMDRGGMIQTNEQYEFVHHALCLFEKDLPESASPHD